MKLPATHRIRVIDTHTGGEPTRVVVHGGPDLGAGTMLQRRTRFAKEFDPWRSAIVCEPRGSDVMVGALLTAPERADSLAGVLFFNNVGFLGMCGHGTMGVAVALAHLGRATHGRFALDTPAGQVWFELLGDGRVAIRNVPSYRYATNVLVRLRSGKTIHGDIAWGGNWFFLCSDHKCAVDTSNLQTLTQLAIEIRRRLAEQGIAGAAGAEIDHVELVGAPLQGDDADARNFVLCPGAAYDRSPCGTGTSAKVACLAADGKLAPGMRWRQASVIGSVFEASFEFCDPSEPYPDLASDSMVELGGSDGSAGDRPGPLISVELVGSAYVNAEAELILNPLDPYIMGIRQ